MTRTETAAEPLRVLHVMAPARAGGLESVVVQLTSGLRARHHDVQVAAVLAPGTEADHPVVQALRDRGVPVHVLVLGTRDYLGERRAVRELLRQTDASVLHTHGYRADAVLGDVARKLGRANVTTLHGFVGGSRRGRFYEWLQIQAARHASAVVAVSQPIVDRLRRHGITHNVELIRNAVGTVADPLSREVARSSLDLPDNVPLVGWVGRVSHEKGADIFVEALARTESRIHGVLIGDGPDLPAVRALASRLGVEGRLHCTGLVSGASRYLKALDLLALTSRTEGTPMILLEAMAMNVPIVATAVGGVPDVLANGAGALVPAGHIDTLSAMLQQYATDQLGADALRAAASIRQRDEFDFSRWIARHENTYRCFSSRKYD